MNVTPSHPSIHVDEEPIVAVLIANEAVTDSECVVTEVGEDAEQTADEGETPARRSWWRRSVGFLGWGCRVLFQLASLVVLLAVLTAIPLLQLIAFGYMLDVAGRLTRGETLRSSLFGLSQAGSIGLAMLALLLASLPVRALTNWESVSGIISPGSQQSEWLRGGAIAAAWLAVGWLLWVWARGGRLRHYLWPEPMRFLREAWRPSTWWSLPDRLWEFTASLELPRLFWLGTRATLGTLVWLLPAMLIIAANRNGETGLAGLVGIISLFALGAALLYLPMLQAHFAAENRLRALFEVGTIRREFRRAPWAWWGAMVCSLVLMPLPLYLLKIEPTPKDVAWLPCLFFVAFMLPARMTAGLALRRARRRPDAQGWWPTTSRWLVRILMVPVVAIYLLFVYVSQYTSWDGLQTWVQQHAILVPVPFVGT